MSKKIKVEEGSGNVFADIGLPNPEERLAEVNLAIRVLRMEIFGYVGRHLRIAALQDRVVEVRGKLMWDGDGFLESHPISTSDIRILK